jgi:L-ribulose-5-phosphate 3-epimerase
VLPERVAEDLPRAVAAIRSAGLKAETMTTAITDPDDPTSREVLHVAAEQGIRFYRTGWLRHPADRPIPESLHDFRSQMQRLGALNREVGIRGAYQNHAGNYVGASLWELWELLRDADPEWQGCQFDIRHATVEGGLSWPQGLRLIRPIVNTIVLKDFRWGQDGGRWQPVNTPMGEGMVDFAAYFRLLKASGLQVPASFHFEYPLGGAEHGRSEVALSTDQIVAAMKRDVEFARRVWREA